MRERAAGWSRVAKRVGFLVALAALASCLSPTEGCGCSPVPNGLYLTGVVTRSDGTSASGLTIRATVFPTICPAADSGAASVFAGRGITDAQGRFRFYQEAQPPSACVRLRLFADTQPTALALLTVDRPGVRIAHFDSLVFSLVVP